MLAGLQQSLARRGITARTDQVVVVVLALYCLMMTVVRLVPLLLPWVAETDWKQWVWQYHRYHESGAFPPGHIINDYVMKTQPPLYWLWMATFSTVLQPVHAATLLNLLAFTAALAAAYWVVRPRSGPVFGMVAAALLARDDTFARITLGGYPRSFGPTLTLLFLAAWMAGRHRLVLVIFVVMAGLYPSVVVPCGLAYGLWSALFAGRAGWWRRNLELGAAGAAVIVLAEMQSLVAPAWWGSVVTLVQAKAMPALGAHGRFTWLPFERFWPKATSFMMQPFNKNGVAEHLHLLPWPQELARGLFVVVTLALLAAALVLPRLRQRQAAAPPAIARQIPFHPFVVAVTSLFAYYLARVFAFQLYLPHRMVQHTLPYLAVVTFVLVVVAGCAALLHDDKRARAAALAVCLSVFVVSGDGVWASGVRSYAKDAPLYIWVHDHIAPDVQIAGSLAVLDEIPLFSARQMYVNWKMAHPIRKGWYGEMERRIRAMMDATYATDVQGVLAFADREKVGFFIVDHTVFTAVEPSLFEPIRADVTKMVAARRPAGFFLAQPPAAAVVFHHRDYDVIDVQKLKAWAAQPR